MGGGKAGDGEVSICVHVCGMCVHTHAQAVSGKKTHQHLSN